MKTRRFLGMLLASGLVSMMSCQKEELATSPADAAINPGSTVEEPVDVTGAPNGTHFTLNIIGVPKGKTANMTTGGRIFVPLTGSCKIMLKEGAFEVLDANGTDGIASFQLPNPDPDNDGTTSYSVFARPLGTPGGTSKTTTCATNPLTGLIVCSTSSYVAVRSKGKSTFTNVSAQLLYVYADLDGDGDVERYPLFDAALEDYFWQYDNNGMKLLQLRFYELATIVP